jgi:hypothetical protein
MFFTPSKNQSSSLLQIRRGETHVELRSCDYCTYSVENLLQRHSCLIRASPLLCLHLNALSVFIHRDWILLGLSGVQKLNCVTAYSWVSLLEVRACYFMYHIFLHSIYTFLIFVATYVCSSPKYIRWAVPVARTAAIKIRNSCGKTRREDSTQET